MLTRIELQRLQLLRSKINNPLGMYAHAFDLSIFDRNKRLLVITRHR